MMLKELYRIGLDMQQTDESWPTPMYTGRKIFWDVHIANDSQFSVTPIDAKDNALGRVMAPDRQRSGRITDKPYLIVDKPAFVLGVGKDGLEAHRHYLEMIQRCADDTGNLQLQMLFRFMQKHRNDLLQALRAKGFTEKDEGSNQWLDFLIAGHRPIEDSDVQHWWLNYVRNAQYELNQEEVCAISGECRKVIRLFPGDIPIRYLDDGRSRTALCKLASVDSPACQSYGFVKSDHAPMSFDAALTASTALKQLLTSPTTSHQMGNVNFAFWTRDGLYRRVVSSCCDEYDADAVASGDVKAIVDSLRQGSAPISYPGEDRFFLFVATNNKSRVVIRASLEATLSTVIASVQHWFKAITVVNVFKKPISLNSLQCSLQESSKRQNHAIQMELLKHAFLSQPISRTTYSQVFPRITSAIHNSKVEPKSREPQFEHVAFIVLYLSQQHPEVMTMGKPDEKIEDIAFQYGRLMAAYERIQLKASPKVQSTVSERFFSAMMCNPLRTVGNLERLSQTHLRKIARDSSPKEAEQLLWQLKRINKAIEPEEAQNCRGFSLDQRGMFVLGYWREKHIFTKFNISQEDTTDDTQSESTDL